MHITINTDERSSLITFLLIDFMVFASVAAALFEAKLHFTSLSNGPSIINLFERLMGREAESDYQWSVGCHVSTKHRLCDLLFGCKNLKISCLS